MMGGLISLSSVYCFIPLNGEHKGLLVCIFTFQYISLLHCKFFKVHS